MSRLEIFCEIDAERERQERKHGPNTCAGQGVSDELKSAILTEENGEVAKAVIEKNRDELKKELVQVAAVAVAWLEALDAPKFDGGMR